VKSFLLGAGASIDAGLPGSFGLTRAVADYIDGSSGHFYVRPLLHGVIGAMVQHDTGRGKSAFEGVDVERVFAAVKALKDRDSIDLSAFVETWNRNVDASNGRVSFPGFWARNFKKAMLDTWDHKVEQEFEAGVRAVVQTSNGDLFGQLESAMLDALIHILRADESRVGYFEPMIRSNSLTGIATLNYDLAVEKACHAAGLTVDTGLETWRGGYEWEWATPQADVRLLKLHGSLDYVLGQGEQDGERVPGDRLANSGEDRQGQLVGGVPAMVFGQGSKLRSDGPFLAMLVEFDRLLSQTEWLTVVGYSFRDDHINAALTRWLNGDRAKRISVIDPSLATWGGSGWDRRGPDYWYYLQRATRAPAPFERQSWTPIESDFLSETAATGLAQLHGS